jgi:hypothetical protein
MAKASALPITLSEATASIFARLAAPFPPERVQWRLGAIDQDSKRGMALAYIDARDVQDRLNEVMGTHWQCRYVPMPNGTTCCEIGLNLDGAWVWRANGAGNTDLEGEKGAYTDAFKRAAVLWGIARYLYGLASPWVAVEQRGRTWAIRKDESGKLIALLKSNGEIKLSAAAARRSGGYPRIERRLRGAKTLKALARIWHEEQAIIAQWPHAWQECITAEKDVLKARLSSNGTLQMLEASLAQVNGAGC